MATVMSGCLAFSAIPSETPLRQKYHLYCEFEPDCNESIAASQAHMDTNKKAIINGSAKAQIANMEW